MSKKRWIGFLLIVLVMMFVGCSSSDSQGDSEVDENESLESSEVEPVEDAQTAGPYELDYGKGLDDQGYYADVAAADFVQLADYFGIEVPSEIHSVSAESVQSEVDSIMTGYTSYAQVTDRAVADGDTLNIDFVGSVDGVEFEGGNTGGLGTEVTIGVTNYIDDFLEQLIGHSPGESFDIEVTFPEDYGNEELMGKDAVFAITINYISEPFIPELTDEFVAENLAEMYLWTTIEEMETEIYQGLQKAAIVTYIQTEILDNSTVETVPESVMDYQKESLANFYKNSANMYGVSLEEVLAGSTGYETLEDLYIASADELNDIAYYSLIIQAIAESENLTVTDEGLYDFFYAFNGTGDYSQYEDAYGLKYLKYIALQEIVMNYLVEHAVLL